MCVPWHDGMALWNGGDGLQMWSVDDNIGEGGASCNTFYTLIWNSGFKHTRVLETKTENEYIN
jgi:hypothetical protein